MGEMGGRPMGECESRDTVLVPERWEVTEGEEVRPRSESRREAVEVWRVVPAPRGTKPVAETSEASSTGTEVSSSC